MGKTAQMGDSNRAQQVSTKESYRCITLCLALYLIHLNRWFNRSNQQTEHTIGLVTGPILIKILNRRLRRLAVGLLLWHLAGYYRL